MKKRWEEARAKGIKFLENEEIGYFLLKKLKI